MTKDEALDLALEFVNDIRRGKYKGDAEEVSTAIKQARSAPVQKRPQNCGTGYCSCVECVMEPAPVQPVATLWQHGETGRTRITMPGDITDCDARWFKAADLYTTPPAQPAPVQEPVAIYQYQPSNGSWIDQDKFSYDYNVRLNQATVRIVYTTPPAQPAPVQEPVAWMAESKNGNVRFTNIGQSADQLESFGWTIFPLYAAPFQFQPLTEEAVLECWKQVYEPGRREHDNATRMARAIEAAHGITKGQP